MPQEFKIEIISPDKTVFLGSAEEVLLPCYEGQITVLKDHIPLITFLRPGVIKIGKNENEYISTLYDILQFTRIVKFIDPFLDLSKPNYKYLRIII